MIPECDLICDLPITATGRMYVIRLISILVKDGESVINKACSEQVTSHGDQYRQSSN